MWMADLVGGIVVLGLGTAIIFFASKLDYVSEHGPGLGFIPIHSVRVIVLEADSE